jgi:putative hydrolase of the HAD superfamily
MMVENPAAVVFDLDDTLYLERDYVRSGYCVVAVTLRQKLGRSEAFEEWLWARFEAGESSGAFDALDQEFALGLSGEDIGELVKAYREHAPAIAPLGGVVALMKKLRAAGVKLGVLSDGYLPAQRRKLEAVGVASLLDAVVLTEELGRDCWKPSAEGFERIAADLGVTHAGCTYVGDNVAKDFVAPNRLGWRTIQLTLPGQVHASRPIAPGGAPDVVVTSIAELADVLVQG